MGQASNIGYFSRKGSFNRNFQPKYTFLKNNFHRFSITFHPLCNAQVITLLSPRGLRGGSSDSETPARGLVTPI